MVGWKPVSVPLRAGQEECGLCFSLTAGKGGSGDEVMDEQEVGVTMEGFKFTKAFLLRG